MSRIADEQVVKRKSGRPPKNQETTEQPVKRPRGRPRKEVHEPRKPPQEEAAIDIVRKSKKQNLTSEMVSKLDNGTNSKYIEDSLAMWDWEQPDMNDPIAVRERVKEYFQLCADRNMKPSVPGFAFSFGVSRKTMFTWVNGEKRHLSAAVINELKKAYYVLNVLMENYMQNGDINPVVGIFLLKNNQGYEDKTEMVFTPNSPIGEELPEDELRKKIAADVVVDAAEIGVEFADK